MKAIKDKKGFTLIEVLISTALFVVIITMAMNVFKLVIQSQQSAIATQNVEESLKYFLEVTSKEIRMAKRNTGGLCGLPAADVYKVESTINGDRLIFKNYHGQCVSYELAKMADGTNRFMIVRDGQVNYYITPAKINVDELHFSVRPESDQLGSQPTVTMELVAHALGQNISKSTMRIQTTLSSRYYKED